MARADKATIDAGTTAEVLMDRAGRAVARAAIRLMGGRYGKRALVVCGKGNNGGDGFVAARVLRAEGVGVDCVVMFDPAEAGGAAAHHLDLMRRAGVHPDRFELGKWEPRYGYDVAVDAIFGTGFQGTVEEGSDIAHVFEILDYLPVVAADIPSGVDGTTGAVRGEAVRADVTVAMQAQKTGTALAPGSDRAGHVEVVDIGVDLSDVTAASASLVEASDVARWLPHREPSAHKKSAGWVVVLAGSEAMRGAALLTCRGAMRMGAGYVTLATTPSVRDAATSVLPELLCERASDEDVLGPEALDRIGDLLDRADALAIGPGLGRGEAQSRLIERVMREVDLPLVVDADALNALEGRSDLIGERGRRRYPGDGRGASLAGVTVLTPHPAELARLLGTTSQEVVGDRLSAAVAAARMGAVVVAKGHRSIVVDHGDAEASIVPVGGPELATAGTGDVLTGAIAARLAAGTWGTGAALVATYVHGVAGELAAGTHGGEGVLAGDVAEALPVAVERLRAGLTSER
ncbi:MAG: NAD(P)H-hydrate dehydratase [Actinobacteria bacterium]|nr:NAD(P)H-hydrate dehydratase [Actinomycetota bacterium]